MKMCQICGVNGTKNNRSRYCPSCGEGLKQVRAQIAMFKHRERVRNGQARHNRTYGGKPTSWAKKAARAASKELVKERHVPKVNTAEIAQALAKAPADALEVLRQILAKLKTEDEEKTAPVTKVAH
jgi:hypothetical protein